MIYHIFANRSNIGDWLSAKGIQKLLAPATVVECLCDEPFLDESFRTLEAAGADDLIIIGGGGLFMDYFMPFWERFDNVAARVPFCIWGVGCCDLIDEDSLPPRELLTAIAQQSALCIVRDTLSREFLKSVADVQVAGCPSLNFVSATSAGHDLLHVTNYTTVGPPAYQVMRSVGQDFAQRTGRKYCETNNLIDKGSENELQAQLNKYAAADVVISSALHGCIIAAAMGAKVLAVSGDRKIEGFMDQVGLGDWVVGNSEVSRLPDLLDVIDQQPDIRNHVELIRGDNRSVAASINEIQRSQ